MYRGPIVLPRPQLPREKEAPKKKERIKEEDIKKERIKLSPQEKKRRANACRRKHFKENPNFRMSINLRNRVNAAINSARVKKFNHTIDLLGCSWESFVKHLESTWQPGMSWENYGKWESAGSMTWHVDHIKPVSLFNLLDPEEQKKAFHWTNTQALWARDNIIKNNNYHAQTV